MQDGLTVREHLENAVVALSDQPDQQTHALRELRGPAMPPLAVHAWDVFGRLNGKRTMGATTPNPISDEAILAHCALLGDRLTPLDVRLIDEADAAMAAAFRDRTAQ